MKASQIRAIDRFRWAGARYDRHNFLRQLHSHGRRAGGHDRPIGKIVTGKISVDDQIAALRKQIGALSEAAKVPFYKDFQALEDLVAAEKKKKEKKVWTDKSTKKTAKKSKF